MLTKKFNLFSSISKFTKPIVIDPKMKTVITSSKGKNKDVSQPVCLNKVNASPSSIFSCCTSTGLLPLPIYFIHSYHHCGEHGHIRSNYEWLATHP